MSDILNIINANIKLVAISVTIILAFFGYFVTHLNNVSLNQSKNKLEYINKQLNELYGPLLVITESTEIAFNHFLSKMRNKGFPTIDEFAPNEGDHFSEWRIWVENVLMHLNMRLETIIIEKSYLISEHDIPLCFKNFIAHNSDYKIIIEKWKNNIFDEYKATLEFPKEIKLYAKTNYDKLKRKQLQLMKYNTLTFRKP